MGESMRKAIALNVIRDFRRALAICGNIDYTKIGHTPESIRESMDTVIETVELSIDVGCKEISLTRGPYRKKSK